jgi:uncharacterized protein YecE (DUF72 family)
VFYPDYLTARKIHPLEYLARFFDVVEINTSFYGPIKPQLAKVWCRKIADINPNFQFTAKLYRSFTHSPLAVMEPTSAATIRPEEDDEARTREGLDSIASREYLEELLEKFKDYPRVVEVRHDTWDNPDTIAYFTGKNVSFCNIDQPIIGRALEPREHVTAPIGYIRLHGRNYRQWFESDNRNDRYNYLYKESELEEWKEKIASVGRRAEKTYVVANNHFEAKAAVNALQLKNLLTGARVKAPEPLLRRYAELGKVADADIDTADPNLPLLA